MTARSLDELEYLLRESFASMALHFLDKLGETLPDEEPRNIEACIALVMADVAAGMTPPS
jgi:hypothetical protein